MEKERHLTPGLVEDCGRLGHATILSWFHSKGLVLSSKKENNFYELLENAIEEQVISLELLAEAIAEIEENSDKKIYLMEAANVQELEGDRRAILFHLRTKYGIVPAAKNWLIGEAREQPSCVYLYWEDNLLKVKFAELHHDLEVDYATTTIKKTPRKVAVLFVIDTADGHVQVRFDAPGTSHTHKNEDGKPTEAAYEAYYKNLLNDMFPGIVFQEFNLIGVANHIATHEREKFRITKGVTTITNNAKQTFASATIKADIRDLPEYDAAAATGSVQYWLTEDLTGYWVVDKSDEALQRDLFMRISRRGSQIRVQRGCFEKELNYGIEQIRQIQKQV